MATSGSVDFSVSRDDLIKAAYRLIGVLDPDGAAITSTQLTNGAEALNMICKELANYGMPLWAIKKYNFALTEGQESYTISALNSISTLPLPERIIGAFTRDSVVSTDPIDIPMNIITRDEYFNFGNKESKGVPRHLYYDPQLTSALSTIYIYPAPDANSATNVQIHFFFHRPFEDFDNSTDTPDFPQRWYRAIKYSLARDLGMEEGVPDKRLSLILAEAELAVQKALDYGQEQGSVMFQPARFGTGK